MRVKTAHARQNRANQQARRGAESFNSGHPLWARYYFERAVRRDPACAIHIAGFYRAKALFDEDRMERRTAATDAAKQQELKSAFDYHWLAKHYYKRALPRQQQNVGILSLLSQEYQQLATLSSRPQQAQHFREKANQYGEAAAKLSADKQNQKRLAADLTALNKI